MRMHRLPSLAKACTAYMACTLLARTFLADDCTLLTRASKISLFFNMMRSDKLLARCIFERASKSKRKNLAISIFARLHVLAPYGDGFGVQARHPAGFPLRGASAAPIRTKQNQTADTALYCVTPWRHLLKGSAGRAGKNSRHSQRRER